MLLGPHCHIVPGATPHTMQICPLYPPRLWPFLPTLSSPAPPILWPPVTSSEAQEKQVYQNLARAGFPIFVLTIG